MLKRIITGVVLLAVAGGLIVAQGWYLRAALLVMALTSFFEMYRAFRKKGMHPVTWPGYLFCVAEALCIWFEDKLAFLDGNHLLMGMTACVMLGIICVVIKGKPDFEAVEATVMPGASVPGVYGAFRSAGPGHGDAGASDDDSHLRHERYLRPVCGQGPGQAQAQSRHQPQ